MTRGFFFSLQCGRVCTQSGHSHLFSVLNTQLLLTLCFYVGFFFFTPSCVNSSLSVPTVDTTRTTWLLERMVKVKRPVLLVGESGTSKTATTQNFLNSLNPDATVSHSQVLPIAL